MRSVLLVIVGVVWGAAMVVAGLANGVFSEAGADGAGRVTAFAFGVLLLLVSGWTLVKHLRNS
jgi:hypothetical protein